MESTTQIFLRVQVTDDDDSAVSGEALVEGYADRMQIDSFTFGMKAKLQAPSATDKKVVNNCQFDQVVVTKFFDRASTRLASLLLEERGSMLSEVRITVDQQLEELGAGVESGSNKAQNAIMVIHLSQARVVDYKLGVTEEKVSASAKETVSFTFQNVSVEYYYKGKSNNKPSDYRDQYVMFYTDYSVQE